MTVPGRVHHIARKHRAAMLHRHFRKAPGVVRRGRLTGRHPVGDGARTGRIGERDGIAAERHPFQQAHLMLGLHLRRGQGYSRLLILPAAVRRHAHLPALTLDIAVPLPAVIVRERRRLRPVAARHARQVPGGHRFPVHLLTRGGRLAVDGRVAARAYLTGGMA